MWKIIINLLIAVVIIGVGAGAGWLIATATNPYPSPTAVAARTATAAPASATNTTPASTTSDTILNATPAAATTPGTAITPSAGQGQRIQAAQITGKLEKYDATTKTVTVATEQGSRLLTIGSARLTKTATFTTDDFSKYANSPLLIVGERGADGTIAARSITAVELPTGGTGQGQQGITGFPGGAGGAGRGAQAGAILVSSSFKDGVLTGQTVQGESVKVAISSNTSLLRQVSGTDSDLKIGANITATLRPNSGEPAEAILVTISD